jgi:ankyrin repeat protein
MVQLLLDRNADIQAKNNTDYTALHLAAENGHEATVRLLLDRKADINAKLDDSRTALQLAIEKGHEATIQLLSDSQPHLSLPSPVNVIPGEKPTLEASNIYSPLQIDTERRNPDNQEPLE